MNAVVEESPPLVKDNPDPSSSLQRVLIVEDLEDTRNSLQQVLEMALGLEVDAAAEDFSNEETVRLGYWQGGPGPAPLGDPDEHVLRRFG